MSRPPRQALERLRGAGAGTEQQHNSQVGRNISSVQHDVTTRAYAFKNLDSAAHAGQGSHKPLSDQLELPLVRAQKFGLQITGSVCRRWHYPGSGGKIQFCEL